MALPRPLLKLGAVGFLLAMAAYSAGFIYYNRHSLPAATLGATCAFAVAERAMRVDRVAPAGPAERAGLRAGDRILAVNGQPLTAPDPFWDAIDRGRAGAAVTLAVDPPGESRVRDVTGPARRLFPPPILGGTRLTATHLAAFQILSLYPLPFLVVAGIVLVQRSHDRHAWLLAVMFGGFIGGLRAAELVPVIHPALRKPLVAYCPAVGGGSTRCVLLLSLRASPSQRPSIAGCPG